MTAPSRLVAIHVEMGIFLGFDPTGTAWWSSHNPLGIPVATTFSSEVSARAMFLSRLPGLPYDQIELVPVDTEGDESASILQMTRAGIVDPKVYGNMLEHQDFVGTRH